MIKHRPFPAAVASVLALPSTVSVRPRRFRSRCLLSASTSNVQSCFDPLQYGALTTMPTTRAIPMSSPVYFWSTGQTALAEALRGRSNKTLVQ